MIYIIVYALEKNTSKYNTVCIIVYALEKDIS